MGAVGLPAQTPTGVLGDKGFGLSGNAPGWETDWSPCQTTPQGVMGGCVCVLARRLPVGCGVGLLAGPSFPRGETGGVCAWQLNPATVGMTGTGLPTYHRGFYRNILFLIVTEIVLKRNTVFFVVALQSRACLSLSRSLYFFPFNIARQTPASPPSPG